MCGRIVPTAGAWSAPATCPDRRRGDGPLPAHRGVDRRARRELHRRVPRPAGRPADLRRLGPSPTVASCTPGADGPARLARRNASDRLLNRRPVLDALGYTSIDEHTSDAIARMRSVSDDMQTDFDLPVLKVNTDDGYEPGLDLVTDFVVDGAPDGTVTSRARELSWRAQLDDPASAGETLGRRWTCPPCGRGPRTPAPGDAGRRVEGAPSRTARAPHDGRPSTPPAGPGLRRARTFGGRSG